MSHSTSDHVRIPLQALPLWHYVPPANIIPSPISIPAKRHAPSSSVVSSSTMSPPKQRKLTKMDYEAVSEFRGQTIKKRSSKRVLMTPKVKQVLERDDMGTGRSPARKLFADGSDTPLGITGVTPIASSSSTSTRRLAPSPPISSSPSRAGPSSSTLNSPATPLYIPLSEEADPHDVGFSIWSDAHADPQASSSTSFPLGTPVSKRSLKDLDPLNPPLALDSVGHIPSSPTSSIFSYCSRNHDEENQENVPPPYCPSITSSPSKLPKTTDTPSDASTTPASSIEDDLFSPVGSSRRKVLERSKLSKSVLANSKSLESIVDALGQDEEEEELTPGRKDLREKGKGKERLAKEVDRA